MDHTSKESLQAWSKYIIVNTLVLVLITLGEGGMKTKTAFRPFCSHATLRNVADMFTKPLPAKGFQQHRSRARLGMS